MDDRRRPASHRVTVASGRERVRRARPTRSPRRVNKAAARWPSRTTRPLLKSRPAARRRLLRLARRSPSSLRERGCARRAATTSRPPRTARPAWARRSIATRRVRSWYRSCAVGLFPSLAGPEDALSSMSSLPRRLLLVVVATCALVLILSPIYWHDDTRDRCVARGVHSANCPASRPTPALPLSTWPRIDSSRRIDRRPCTTPDRRRTRCATRMPSRARCTGRSGSPGSVDGCRSRGGRTRVPGRPTGRTSFGMQTRSCRTMHRRIACDGRPRRLARSPGYTTRPCC